MHSGSLSSKGQTTIPIEIRNLLNLKPGVKLEFFTDGELITIMPINKSIKSLKGLLKRPSQPLSCEEMDNIIRKVPL